LDFVALSFDIVALELVFVAVGFDCVAPALDFVASPPASYRLD
jgi:hypothetical protein